MRPYPAIILAILKHITEESIAKEIHRVANQFIVIMYWANIQT